MTKLKTSSLKDHTLDWAVATCEGYELNGPYEIFDGAFCLREHDGSDGDICPDYSTDWSHGGPIIEKMRGLKLKIGRKPGAPSYAHIVGYNGIERWHQTGKTPLIAAMRCYIASKLGDTIDIPNKLTNKDNNDT